MKALFVVTTVLLAAHGAAATDCLEPFAASSGWACHADLSDGTAVDYCVQHTNTFGDDPAARFFRMKSAGPYVSTCTCGAKGKGADAAFGEAKSVFCVDRGTDTVTSGKIATRKFAGQTWNLSANVRSTFTCAPDPVCSVQEVIDPDLAALQGTVDLPLPPGQSRADVLAGGAIDVGYLGGGCNGFASEAPTATYRVNATIPGTIGFFFVYNATDNGGSMVVMTPSGEAHCAGYHTYVTVPAVSGSYSVWIAGKTAADAVDAELVATYFEE
jgi:hypothetical protein